jgi:SAM-dependent methyltransferase
MDENDPRLYGERWATAYDEEHTWLDPTDAVKFLHELGGEGPALELGIGTGRVALPLARLGVQVHGVDISEAMVGRLRSKPGGRDLEVTVCDMTEIVSSVRYRLVYVVYNTIASLLSQEKQVDCFISAARHLASDGRFVVECYMPDIARFRDGQQCTRVLRVTDDCAHIGISLHDPVEQRVRGHIVRIDRDRATSHPLFIRYAWPSELDLMGRIAGLQLQQRWGGWRRDPFTAASRAHVSVYAPAAGGPR